MANAFFQFKKFIVWQDLCAMKVCTDSCLFGAYVAAATQSETVPPATVLDIGGGTGLLTLMLAQRLNAKFDAVEIDERAADQMRENFQKSLWHDRLNVICADAREMADNKRYDLVISNPPFYENDLESDIKEVALARHGSGLLLSELAQILSDTLNENGRYYVITPAYRSAYMTEVLAAEGLSIDKKIMVGHSAQHPPFRIFFSGSKKKAVDKPFEESLSIYAGDSYSPSFRHLLHDYYLNL